MFVGTLPRGREEMGRLATAVFIIILLLPRVHERYAYAGVNIECATVYRGHDGEIYPHSLNIPKNHLQDDTVMQD